MRGKAAAVNMHTATQGRHLPCTSLGSFWGRMDPQEHIQERRAPSCCFLPPCHPSAAGLEEKSLSPPPLLQSSAEGCRILQGAGVFSMQERAPSKSPACATVHWGCRAAGLELQNAAVKSGAVGEFVVPPLLPSSYLDHGCKEELGFGAYSASEQWGDAGIPLALLRQPHMQAGASRHSSLCSILSSHIAAPSRLHQGPKHPWVMHPCPHHPVPQLPA